MLFKDYYSILGLQKTASPVQIKHAFYRLALKYHPDKNPLDPASSNKFMEISEANRVLGDPDKRQIYDRLFIRLENDQSPKKKGYENYFAQKRKNYQGKTSCPHTTMKGDFTKKGSCFSFMNDFINAKFSSKVNNNSHSTNNCNPYRTIIHIPLEDTLHGVTRNIFINNTKVPVWIAPGVTSGKKIIYHGLFSDSYPFLKRDLIITVLVNKHSMFKRYNQHLACTLDIDLYTAILGGLRKIITLDNKILRLRIPESTGSGTLLRLKGQGLPFPSNTRLRGDLFIKITIHMPENLSKYELSLFEKLAVLRKTAPS